MPSFCPNMKILIAIFCTSVTIVLWALYIWQLILRLAPDTTPPQELPCFCQNHGICPDRICLCPEEWIGSYCEIVNFCDSSTYTVNSSQDFLHFERIIIGRYGYSVEKCDNGTVNGGAPRATRMCTRKNGVPALEPPSLMNCNATLVGLFEKVQSVNESSPTEIMSIATDMQILTSKPEQLQSKDISLAASIAKEILNQSSSAVPSETAAAAVTTISQLMDANKTQFSLADNNLTSATVSLTMAMQNFSVSNTSTQEVVQPNIVVRTVALQETSAKVLFSVLKGSTSGFVPDRINIDEQANGLTSDDRTEIQILINVSSANSNGKERVGFVVYQNDRLFPSKIYTNKLDDNYSNRIVSGNANGAMVHNVKIALSPQSFRKKYEYARPLEMLSYIGCGLSIFGLFVTILFQILTRKTRRKSTTLIFVSLCSSLLLFNIIFISGIENSNANESSSLITARNTMLESDEEGPPVNVSCTAVAALLHFFLLATFMWTAINSVQLYLLLVKTQRHFCRHYSTLISLTGWAVPALIVSVTLAATYQNSNYRQEEFCWLAALDEEKNFSIEKPMLWAFLLPVAVILLINIAVFVKIMFSVTWKENKHLRSTQKKSLMKKIFSTLSTIVVLGITWILGYLVLVENKKANIVFSYVFCIFSATQGLQMFLFHVVGTPIFKKKATKVFASLSEIRIYLHSKTYYISDILHRKSMFGFFRPTNSMRNFDDLSSSSSVEELEKN